MITLQYMLTLPGLPFALSFAGTFLNRTTILPILMCLALMLLAVYSSFLSLSLFPAYPPG